MSFTSEQKKAIENLIESKINSCRVEVDKKVENMHEDMFQLRKEFHEFRTEFSDFAESLSIPLKQIAIHMETLAGLPEAWANFKGFLGVLNWIKNNLFVLFSIIIILSASIVIVAKGLF